MSLLKAVENAKSVRSLSSQVVVYLEDGILVRNSLLKDVHYLKTRLKQSDINEVKRSHGYTPEEALMEGWKKSLVCYTLCMYDRPIAMCGINPESFIGNKAVVWFLSSPEIDMIKVKFIRNSRLIVDKFLDFYGVLFNYVDISQTKTIKWLKRMGAKFEEPVLYGVSNMPFVKFTFTK